MATLAVAIFMGALPRDARAETPAAAPRPAPAPATPPSTKSLQRPPAYAPETEGLAGARAVFDTGSLPRPTIGVGLLLAVARGPLVVELQATDFRGRFSTAGNGGNQVGVQVGFTAFDLAACLRAPARSLELRGCLGGELGLLTAHRPQNPAAEGSSALTSAVTAGLSVRLFPNLKIGPRLGVTFGQPLTSGGVIVDGVGSAFDPPAFFGRAFVGLDARFF